MPAYTKWRNASLTWYGDELAKESRLASRQVLLLAGHMLEAQTQRNLSASSSQSGPSLPGDFPHLITGALRNSLYVKLSPDGSSVEVGTTLAYGYWLEYGTPGGKVIHAAPGKVFSWIDRASGQRIFSKTITLGALAPRPFLRRTLAQMLPQLRQLITSRLGGALKGPLQ